jgi:hypothetical protein
MIHGPWTDGAPGSMVDQSSAGAGAVVVHGRHTARQVRGLTGGVGEGEQGRVRPGDGLPRRDRWRRGGATGLEITMAAALRRWWCRHLGGEENEGGVWGTMGRGKGPFIVAGRGYTRARKGETVDSGSGIKGA